MPLRGFQIMDKIDATIGKSIRHYRWLQGISQAELALAIGITETQLRSHEAGKSRISAGRLMLIAGHLGVDVSAFFQRFEHIGPSQNKPELSRPRMAVDSVRNGKYLAALMTHFQRLNETQKQAVLQLVVSISKETSAPPAAVESNVREMATSARPALDQWGRDGPY